MVDSSQKVLKSLTPYHRFFDFSQLSFKDPIVMPYASVFNTLDHIQKVVTQTLSQTKAIATHLKGKTFEQTLQNNWHFVHDHIGYEKDQEGVEQIRTPIRLIKDRIGDCDCFSTFLSSLLTNQGIEHSLRMTKYSGDWQHVYVIVPQEGKKGYYTLDCVLHEFDKEEPFTQKYDKRMQLQVLNGISQPSVNGIGNLGIISALPFGAEFEDTDELGSTEPSTGQGIELDFLSRVKQMLINTLKELEANPNNHENPEELADQLEYAIENFNNAAKRDEALARLEAMESGIDIDSIDGLDEVDDDFDEDDLEIEDYEEELEGLDRRFRGRFSRSRLRSKFFNKRRLTRRLNPVSRTKRHLKKLNPRRRFAKRFNKRRLNPVKRLKKHLNPMNKVKRFRKLAKKSPFRRRKKRINYAALKKRNAFAKSRFRNIRSNAMARKSRFHKCKCNRRGIRGFEDDLEMNLDLEGLGRRRRRRKRRGRFWKRLRKSVKKVGQAAKKGLKKFGKTKIGKFVKKVGKALVKYNPLTIAIRNGFYLAMRINFMNISGRLYYGRLSVNEAKAKNMNLSEHKKAQKVYKRARNLIVNKFQGSGKVFDKYLAKGIAKAKRKGKINGLEGFEGLEGFGLGEVLAGIGTLASLGEPATAASVTAASGVLATIGAWLKKINFKKLFNAVKKVKNILPKRKGKANPAMPNTMMQSANTPYSAVQPTLSPQARRDFVRSNDQQLPQDKKSNMGLYLGIGAGVLALGAALMMGGKKGNKSSLNGTRNNKISNQFSI